MRIIYYCDKCKKVVPEQDVKQLLTKKWHFTTKTVNFYTQYGRYQPKGAIGYCPVAETRMCGLVDEYDEDELL